MERKYEEAGIIALVWRWKLAEIFHRSNKFEFNCKCRSLEAFGNKIVALNAELVSA